MVLKFAYERVARRLAGAQHHEGFDDIPAIGVGAADDGRLQHRRMFEQRAFNLEGTDAVSARRDDVVGTADKPKVAVVVLLRPVAREIPLAAARRERLGLTFVVTAKKGGRIAA